LEKLRILLIVTWFHIAHKNVHSVFLHNDLAFSNILLAEDGSPIFIDFEDAIFEKKLILSDLVDLLFDWWTVSLNMNDIEHAWRRLARALTVDPRAVNMRSHIRVCLIKTALNALRSTHAFARDKNAIRSFLLVLLDSHQYEIWLQEQYRNAPLTLRSEP
jgi:thiamine kinase-like enzyme